MPEPAVRPFRRADREQLTGLVNAHVCAVVPGWAVSASALLAQIERDPGQYVTDPWVAERRTLLAEVDSRVVAAAHLRRYRDDPDVGSHWRAAGEIAWLVCWPAHEAAGERLVAACVRALGAWGVQRRFADGDLSTSATYGIPDSWPHLGRVLAAHGFDGASARLELLLADGLDAVPELGPPPLEGLAVRRVVGTFGARSTRWSAGVWSASSRPRTTTPGVARSPGWTAGPIWPSSTWSRSSAAGVSAPG